ncbi:zinc/cadmium resistance protein [Aplysia californica]|uniref:Zinc/cadmium resistance protein n=1 Tax=Aplysia californica TaxID=6500 RepID=A0ABM0K9Y6_APLCA|nr:zinc/cadmium resistance protein [Aplysia californica]
MGRYSGKTCRLSVMLAMTASFFLVEIIVGYVTNSIALVADSFHMLSDVVALIVGFASVRISKWPSKRNTYGWVRAEILGALVNAVFLLALCFSILVEALKRLVNVEEVDNPKLLLIVGSVGLAVNLVGLFLFGGHGHSHGGGGHGHSHGGGGGGGHGHSHGGNQAALDDMEEEELRTKVSSMANGSSGHPVENEALVTSEGLSRSSSDDKEVYTSQSTNITIEVKKPKIAHSSQLNMRGVFLHVLGDALGSIVVIVSALVIMFVDGDWKYSVDPGMSIVMVIIILSTTIPLLKESAFILLQTVPSHVNVESIITELEQMEGIYGVHECHIWQLAGNRIVASAHIRCRGIEEYMSLATKIKALFHKAGIHSTTIQPEFVDYLVGCSLDPKDCAILCDIKGDPTCKVDTCCGDRDGWLSKRAPSDAQENALDRDQVIGVGADLNNSAHSGGCGRGAGVAAAYSSTRSLDVQFSRDGDEVVLEVSDILSPMGHSGGVSEGSASGSSPPKYGDVHKLSSSMPVILETN